MAASTQAVTAPSLSLPRGGGAISGLGETQQPSPFAGGATLSIPLPITPARGAEPRLALTYDASAGNGPFGIGFSVTIPSITRRTNQHIPRYDDHDVFLLTGQESLVPALEPRDGAWVMATRQEPGWRVVEYRPKVESDFPRIERWIDDASPGISYWQVTSASNVIEVYGKDPSTRIADPDDPTRIFQWLLESTVDSTGNKLVIDYKQEDHAGLPPYSFAARSTANRYPRSIRYGTYLAAGIEAFAFELRFDYGEFDWQTYRDASPWALRADPFSTYRPGFELRTQRLCRNILLFHQFPSQNGGAPFLVRALRLGYTESAVMSSLTSIVEEGFRPRDGGYDSVALPPLTCSYAPFAPLGHAFGTLQVAPVGSIPGGLTEYEPVDLYGEGLPGFLVSNSTVSLYFRPEGNASYALPQAPRAFPIDRALGATLSLQDLDGNAQLSLVVNDGARKGYYRDRYDGQWGAFTPFASAPTALDDPAAAQVDVDGSGRSALIVARDGAITYYPSRGFHGYAAAAVVPAPAEFPLEGTGGELVGYADLFGDGLAHRVRIRDGEVACWPDLGYGRFGAKLLFGNAPRFPGGLDPTRLVLADLDGAGPRDLIYVLDDRLAIYLNQSGNAFADPIYLPLPTRYSSLDQLRFVDVLGNGTAAMVLSKLEPEVTHYYYTFGAGAACDQTKPYVLVGYDNHLGAQTTFRYATSTWFYLEDRKQGRSWPTRLPFPVQVVAERTTRDAVSGTSMTTRYRYHDGYYDFQDRVFRGFGYVETWDAESYEAFTARFRDQETTLEQLNEARYVPPVYTRTWYHIGALGDAAAVADAYRRAYSHADPRFTPLASLALDPAIDREDPRTLHVAYEALNGRMIHQEVYALERDGSFGDPISVSEASYYVQLVQPRAEQRYPVVAVSSREQLRYEYERDPTDPRISHEATLAVDRYAHPTVTCAIAYPRRPAPGRVLLPEQAELQATAARQGYLNTVDGARWLGVPNETQRYELAGLDPAGREVLSFDQLAEQVGDALAHVIPYGEPFIPGARQARDFGWDRSYYWDADQRAALPLEGPLPTRALLHHNEIAVFTPAVIARAFAGRLSDAELADQGGYVHDAATGYWWNRGLVATYGATPESYYLLREVSNAFVDEASPLYARTTLGYDEPYALQPVRRSEFLDTSLENTATAELDYAAMQPWRHVDPNGNVSEVRFDPLAQVVLRSVYKPATLVTPRQGDDALAGYGAAEPATFDAVIADPHRYLKQVTAYYYYDLEAWRLRGQPANAITVQRDTHVSELVPPAVSRVQLELAYFDGALRVIEHKRQVEPGPAVRHDPRGQVVREPGGAPRVEAVIERWVVSGRVVLNNKGAEAERYLPYFSDTPRYEDQAEVAALVPPPTITRYDAVGRGVRVETSKGFIAEVAYAAWQTARSDEDDTVTASPFYRDNYDRVGPDEKDALDKAAVFEATPAIEQLDPRGRAVRTVAELVSDVAGTPVRRTLTTFHAFDIQGRELITIDPRLYAYDLDHTLPPDQWRTSFRHQLAMTGAVLQTTSADAGSQAGINNLHGKPFHLWDARGFEIRFSYDRLQRPIAIRVTGVEPRSGLALDQVVEKMTYGEGQPDAEAYNLRGQLYQHHDQAGVATFPAYTFEGELAETTRQLLADYRTEVDWSTSPPLEPDVYRVAFAYDALRRVLRETLPDGATYVFTYLASGWLGSLTLVRDDGTAQGSVDLVDLVRRIDYDANGQRTEIRYGNGVVTTYRYEPTTTRLAAIESTRPGGETIQAVDYTYDPTGNITRIQDRTYQHVFRSAPPVEPRSDYTYDSTYRLLVATGRQHTGIAENTYIDGFKQSIFAGLDSVALEMYCDHYTYDDSGNLTRRVHDAGSLSWTREQPVADDNNRLLGVSYDAGGNTLELALDRQAVVTWNVRNLVARVAPIVHADGIEVTEYYVYDSKRARVRTVTLVPLAGGGTETRDTIRLGSYERVRITRSPGGPALERIGLLVRDDRRLVAIAYHWLAGGPGAGARALRYQLDNYLESTAVELDEAAALLSFEEYDAYGGTSLIAGPDEAAVEPKTLRFSAKERLDTTTLYDYGLRFFAPWMGRWMSPDPAGAADGLNLYAFVSGNPVTLIDRDGQCGDKPSHEPVPRPPITSLSPIFDQLRQRLSQGRSTTSTSSLTKPPSLIDTFKALGYGGALFNAFSEIVEHKLHHFDHAPITPRNIVPKSLFLFSQAHTATAAIYGGVFGIVPPLAKIYKDLRNGETPQAKYFAAAIGSALFTREGILIAKSWIPSLYPTITSRQIGLTGGFADLFKVFYYASSEDPKNVVTYSLLSTANFRFAGLFPRLPSPTTILGLALLSAIPSEELYDLGYQRLKARALQLKAALTPAPPPVPGQHWTSSSNVLNESLRLTAGTTRKK